jgi:hypothetical protein
VPVERVVNALRAIHGVLVPDGVVIDSQPISARPPVESAGVPLGTLDMRAWRATIDAVEAQVSHVLAAGLFTLEHERSLVVSETFDNGPELVDTVSGWDGTSISRRLARAVSRAAPPLAVHQEVRLRALRAQRRSSTVGDLALASASPRCAGGCPRASPCSTAGILVL